MIVAIVAVGATLAGLIIATDDGARIDARIDALDNKIDALDAKLSAKIDALDAKVDDIRVYIAAKHGDRVSFVPRESGKHPRWLVRIVDPATDRPATIGTLEVRGDTERIAKLQVRGGTLAKEWTHLGEDDTLRRARILVTLASSKEGALPPGAGPSGS